MKKFSLVGLALVAVLAFSAVIASAASAEIIVWLVDGALLAAEQAAETEGSLALITLSAGVVINEVLCEGIFDGNIGPDGADLITKVLKINHTEITELGVAGEALECAVDKDPGNNALLNCEVGVALVRPDVLPWVTELELMANGSVLDVILNGAYDVECKVLFGITASDLCLVESVGGTATNDPTTSPASVLGEFTEADNSEAIKAGPCEVSGNIPDQIGSGHTWGIGAQLERLTTEVSEVAS